MRPPPISRSYRTADRINAEKHFSLELYLSTVLPYPDYVEAVRKASAAMSEFEVERGTRSPFPSAFSFIEEVFGTKKRDRADKLSRANREWSVRLLRTAFKLRRYVDSRPKDWASIHVRCHKCGKKTIRTRVGMLEPLADIHPRIVSVEIECGCKKFQTSDYYEIEALALSEML